MTILSSTGISSGNSSGMTDGFRGSSESLSHGRRRVDISYMRLIGLDTANKFGLPTGLITADDLSSFSPAYKERLRGGDGVYAFCVEMKAEPWSNIRLSVNTYEGQEPDGEDWELYNPTAVQGSVTDPSSAIGKADWLSQAKTDVFDGVYNKPLKREDVHLVYFPMIPAGFNRAVTAPHSKSDEYGEYFTDEEKCYFKHHGHPESAYSGNYSERPTRWGGSASGSSFWNWGSQTFPLNQRIFNHTFIAFTKDYETPGRLDGMENPCTYVSMFRPDFSMYLKITNSEPENPDGKVGKLKKGWFEVGEFKPVSFSYTGQENACDEGSGEYTHPECSPEDPTSGECKANTLEISGTGHYVFAINNSGSEIKSDTDSGKWFYATIDVNGDLSITPVPKCRLFSPFAIGTLSEEIECEKTDSSSLTISASELEYPMGGFGVSGSDLDSGESCCYVPWGSNEATIEITNPMGFAFGNNTKLLLSPMCNDGDAVEQAFIVQVEHECINVLAKNKPDYIEGVFGDHSVEPDDYSPGEIKYDSKECPDIDLSGREISVPKGSKEAVGANNQIKSVKKKVVTDINYSNSDCVVRMCTEDICVLEAQDKVDENTSPGEKEDKDPMHCEKVWDFQEMSSKCCNCVCNLCYGAEPDGVINNKNCEELNARLEFTKVMEGGVPIVPLVGCHDHVDAFGDDDTSVWAAQTSHGTREILWLLKCVDSGNNSDNRTWELHWLDANCHRTDAGNVTDVQGNTLETNDGCCNNAFTPIDAAEFIDGQVGVPDANNDIEFLTEGCCLANDSKTAFPCYEECDLIAFKVQQQGLGGCTLSPDQDCPDVFLEQECEFFAGCTDCDGNPVPADENDPPPTAVAMQATMVYINLTGKFNVDDIDMDSLEANCKQDDATWSPPDELEPIDIDAEVDMDDNQNPVGGDAMWAAIDSAALKSSHPSLFRNGQVGFYASIRAPRFRSDGQNLLDATLLSITDSTDATKNISLKLSPTSSTTAILTLETGASSTVHRMDYDGGAQGQQEIDFSDNQYKEIILSVDDTDAIAFVNGVPGQSVTESSSIIDADEWHDNTPDQIRMFSPTLNSEDAYVGKAMSMVLYGESVVPLSISSSEMLVNYYFEANQSNQIVDSTGTLNAFTVPPYWTQRHWPYEPAAASVLASASSSGTPTT